MDNELKLLTTRNFNGVEFNCYGADGSNDGDFWATREQIGQLLEYSDPDASIRNIHSRNRERLNKFSTRINLIQVEGTKNALISFLPKSF